MAIGYPIFKPEQIEALKELDDKAKLIELESKKKSVRYIQMGIGSVGTVGGFIYANRTGGGFWRYVGFGILGGIAAGSIAYFTTMQNTTKINEQIAKIKLEKDGK